MVLLSSVVVSVLCLMLQRSICKPLALNEYGQFYIAISAN